MNENNSIVIYQSEDGKVHLDVVYNEETMWLTQQQMSDLYQTSRTNVVEHIKHIYEDGELTEEATCRKFRQVRLEGNRSVEREIPHYNLDMILSLGYRVRSVTATRFRQLATVQYYVLWYFGFVKRYICLSLFACHNRENHTIGLLHSLRADRG